MDSDRLVDAHHYPDFSLSRKPIMTTLRKLSALLATSAIAISLVGCGSMSSRDRSTAVGAGVGALGGAVLGGTAATIGGAAVGGVIGNQMGKDNK